MNTQCISYVVDVHLLNAGVPVEQLEKRHYQIYSRVETMEDLNRWLGGVSRLGTLRSQDVPHSPDFKNDLPIIQLNKADFKKVKSYFPIRISDDFVSYNGKKVKLFLTGTTSYLVRSLTICGESAFFN